MPTILYHIQNGQIGINQSRPNLEIHQKEADLSIKQPAAILEIKTTPGRLLIDQTEAFADVDYKGILRRSKEWTAKAIQEINANIAKIAREGDQMMQIENGGNVFAQIAKADGFPPMKERNLAYIPKDFRHVKIDITPTKVDINVQRRDPIIESKINKPELTYHRWQTDVYMLQKPNLSFEVIGSNLDIQG